MKPIKIAFANSKGGTAKTASTQNMAHALADKGKKVLCVDFDPQSSLTYSFGLNPLECDSSIADVLLENESIANTIVETTVDGVDLVCGSLNMSSFDLAMRDDSSRESKLTKALSKVGGYDYVLLDTSPSAGLLMINALLGVDHFITPVKPEFLAFQGLSTMMDIVSRVKRGFGSCASLLGILLTQVDYRNNATHELVNLIRKHYKSSVFKSEVRINVRVSEAPSFGKTIFQHDDECSGALAYRKLANEIIKKTRNGGKNE